MKIGKIDVLKVFLAVTLVLPIAYEAVVHLYGFVKDSATLIVKTFKDAVETKE